MYAGVSNMEPGNVEKSTEQLFVLREDNGSQVQTIFVHNIEIYSCFDNPAHVYMQFIFGNETLTKDKLLL